MKPILVDKLDQKQGSPSGKMTIRRLVGMSFLFMGRGRFPPEK
ncbi:MAG: hypothetical protein AAGD22_08290 [Verrucomicrobiota bacterium]